MALPWPFYAGIVIFGATGLHVFSKLAKGTIDPTSGLVFAMGAAFVFALLLSQFADSSFVKSFGNIKGIALYALVGVSVALANIGIFWMFQAGAPISIATPLVRFGPAVFAVLLGVLLFNEVLKIHHVIGLIFGVISFYLLTKG